MRSRFRSGKRGDSFKRRQFQKPAENASLRHVIDSRPARAILILEQVKNLITSILYCSAVKEFSLMYVIVFMFAS